MSKVGVNALTRIQQKAIDSDTSRRGIVVSCVCPGYCKTDMTRGGGLLPAKEGTLASKQILSFLFRNYLKLFSFSNSGAETPAFLCLLPEDWTGPKGAFWAESKNKNLNWETGIMLTTGLSMVSKKISSFFK
jgi:NAD(P)-dependent dehydrogenase (short-subunit alcohol dehydrogenase family)